MEDVAGDVSRIALIVLVLCLPSYSSAQEIDVRRLEEHVQRLCDERFRGRPAGEEGERLAGDYIMSEFKRYGLKGFPTDSAYDETFLFDKRTPTRYLDAGEEFNSRNIIGYIPGIDTTVRDQLILVVAHYDAMGHGDWTHQLLRGQRDLFVGADDNASGVAGLLELARYFSSRRDPLRRGILFIALGAGEIQQAGAWAALSDTMLSGKIIQSVVELNSIGRYRDTLFVAGITTSPSFKQLASELQGAAHGDVVTKPFSEHHAGQRFAKHRIPTLTLSTGASQHFKIDDIPKGLNFENMHGIVRSAAEIVIKLSLEPELIKFSMPAEVSPSAGEPIRR